MSIQDDDLDAELTRLFAETPKPWTDPVGVQKVLARTVHQESRPPSRWLTALRGWWIPALAVAASVTVLLAVPGILSVLQPTKDEPSAPIAEADLALGVATRACKLVEPRADDGIGVNTTSGASFMSPTMTLNGEVVANPDPFPGTVEFPQEPRFCLFRPLTRTARESRYRFTVLNPADSDFVVTDSNPEVQGVLYGSEVDGRYVYFAIFRFQQIVKASDYYDAEQEDHRITPTADGGIGSYGFSVNGRYISLTFASDEELASDQRLGVMAKTGEALPWLASAALLAGADVRPMPEEQPMTLDLAKGGRG